jgi:DNA (cytosine-5)-methyltransferase 1
VAQRRRRVFLVASARRGFDPSKLLFESEGVRRDTPPSREAGQGITHDLAPCLTSSDRGVARAGDTRGQDAVYCLAHGQGGSEIGVDRAPTLSCNHEAPVLIAFDSRQDCVSSTHFCGALSSASPQAQAVCVTGGVAHTLKAEGFEASEDGTGRGQPIVAVALRGREGGATAELGDELSNCLRASGGGGDKAHCLTPRGVRRLTPRECERLQGMPDGHTQVPYPKKLAADGPRYKAIGNSMAVPCMAWLGQRLQTMLY